MIKIAINNDYLLKDYTEESFPHSMIVQYDYQEIELDDKYYDCTIDDFDYIGGIYKFNVDLYTINKNKRNETIYNNLVSSKIREKYSLDAELSILRQKADKPAEYQEYYLYCEKCKKDAKQKLNIK